MLVVIGGGPYGIAAAAKAIEAGIDTVVVGRPFSFWTDNMPAGMYLRSGPDWHLDASQVHTFEAFLDERDIKASDVDPVPIATFLEYAGWFQRHKHVAVRETLVTGLTRNGEGSFLVALDNGETLAAESVVAAPGVRYFQHRPEWSTSLPESLCSHTCELVGFDDFEGARVLIVSSRQSAYEWAALAGEHGAERVDIVHRHDVPRFDRVSWKFVDPYMEQTLATAGLVADAVPLRAGSDHAPILGGRQAYPRMVADAPAAGGPVHPAPGHVGRLCHGPGPGRGPGTAERRHRAHSRPDRARHGLQGRSRPRAVPRRGARPRSRWPAGSRCSTRHSRPASPAFTCRASRAPGTSARSSASRRAARPQPHSSRGG